MRLPRIFSAQALAPGREVRLDANATRHLTQVLRLRAGDTLILFDGSGQDFDAELLADDRQEARARVGAVRRSEPESTLSIHLALGISRGERMDFALQKAVELGVESITPLFTDRTVVRLRGERLEAREAHWRGVIRHACEQSGRSRLPDLSGSRRIDEWLRSFAGQGILLDHRATTPLPALPPPDKAITLLVGPEGGLTPQEREQASKQGLQGVRLGPRVLRTETAPLAAIAAIQAVWGDFR
jgi:16S rRNA (uracil1498-N3)-methyltransferase